ncbi:PREDICTED: uncharacterized protein LOC106100547 [Papilio polytes]|uniref:uncharacterized protein LOC106100547 n=1 Tax=Papilio polytes TaxID=76194 RepID=UPI0006764826|nr:PREDICTED: uncharacterized protein LOC106100547 [Papilio polytes]
MGSRRFGKDGHVFKNEYVFGDCKNPKKIYYEKHHKTVQEVQRASVIRDWLFDTWRIPTCIILRASSYESNAFRLTYYNFEICVPRVTFCYDKKRWNYYYYEWYIPKGITYGSDWDIYFYGPNKSDWTLQWG